jgi:regulator of protease activity HflC (stomatin/prohibitin superfamily)|nr:slipin family protein [Kofleriaceae bacterium]
MTTLNIDITHRAVLIRDGRIVRALGPGRYLLWRHHDVIGFDTTKLVFDAPAAIVAALPHDWYEVVTIATGHYGVVTRDERAVAFLQPGIHRVWKVDANVRVRVFVDTDPLPELTKELRAVIPAGELVEVTVELTQRAVLLRDGRPDRVLAPGRYAFWGKQTKLIVWNVDDLVFVAPPAVLAMLPQDWYRTLHLDTHARAVVFRDDKPIKFLRPGLHRVWTVDPTVAVRTYAVTDPAPELTDELRAVIPVTELVEVPVKQFERGLKYVQGKFEGLLEPGKHAFWTHANARVTAQVLDTRVQQLKVEGQELMTRDKVTLRLTLTVEYAPTDTATTVHAVADVKDALYLAVQLAAREYLAGVTLDELLEGRDTFDRYLAAQVAPRADTFGVRVHRVGVKDVILPGDMKLLLNKVIEAEKVAAANVILRREDAAATRNMANTAKVIADNPVLMRLKELETMKEIADKIDELKLVLGAGDITQLLPLANGQRD